MIFRFFHGETGIIHPNLYSTSIMDSELALESAKCNAPEGHVAIDGRFDHLSQRIDVGTGKVVDYQPPAPSIDHEWHAESKRWHLKPEVQAINAARQVAHMTIEHQERTVQPRAQRELLLAIAKKLDVDATRLEQIEQAIVAARKDL